jgi:hypothetical protein
MIAQIVYYTKALSRCIFASSTGLDWLGWDPHFVRYCMVQPHVSDTRPFKPRGSRVQICG